MNNGLGTIENLTITSTGAITHAAQDTSLQIVVTGTLQIDAGGKLDVSGAGCPAQKRWDTSGEYLYHYRGSH